MKPSLRQGYHEDTDRKYFLGRTPKAGTGECHQHLYRRCQVVVGGTYSEKVHILSEETISELL